MDRGASLMKANVHSDLELVSRHFASLEDPHSEVNLQHPLLSVIVIAFMAILAGADGPTAIAKWALLKIDLLKVLYASRPSAELRRLLL
jgi:hypothetical protein